MSSFLYDGTIRNASEVFPSYDTVERHTSWSAASVNTENKTSNWPRAVWAFISSDRMTSTTLRHEHAQDSPIEQTDLHRTMSRQSNQNKPWRNRQHSSRSEKHETEEEQRLSRQASTSKRYKSPWWKIRLFRGMIDDVKRRAPHYTSDWLDAWDYRVIPATFYMYFANILPALAFSLDMFVKTSNS